MDSFVFIQQVLFRVDFLSVTLDHRVQCPRVGLGHLKKSFFFCFYFSLKPQSHIHGFGPNRATVHPDLASR